MLRHSVRHYNSRLDRYNPVKCILRKALKQIKPTNTPNECGVEEICLPQNPRNYKSDLSAHSQILFSQLLQCCDTQFGTIKACMTASLVLTAFYAKVEGNQAKKYPKRMQSRGDMAAGKSSNPKKKNRKTRDFRENIIKSKKNHQVIKKSKSQHYCEKVDFFSRAKKSRKIRLFLAARKKFLGAACISPQLRIRLGCLWAGLASVICVKCV